MLNKVLFTTVTLAYYKLFVKKGRGNPSFFISDKKIPIRNIMKLSLLERGQSMRYLFLLIIVIPALDIGVLLFSGKTIGVWPTIALIILTGVIGAYLAKREGLQTIRRVQEQLSYGQLPGDALLDGICILIGGTLLLTPGFMTDVSGFFFLFPPTRKPIKILIIKMWQRKINKGNIKIIK